MPAGRACGRVEGMTEFNEKTDLNQKQVLVYGTGISGIGAAKLLLKLGAFVTLYDENEAVDKKAVIEKVEEGQDAGGRLQVLSGALDDKVIDVLHLAVFSPGVPCDIPNALRLKEAGVPIWGEVELAWQAGRGDVLAITGTNGKTTTTTLLGEIMSYHVQQGTEPVKDQCFVVGNIGTPYTGASLKMTDDTVSVAEISSFQLETIHRFHPAVSAITNITPDHLNRHHTMEEYIRVKERICENQTGDEACVLNYEDPVLRAFGEKVPVKTLFFSSLHILEEGLCLHDGVIELHTGKEVIPVLPVKELKLPGRHNYENVMTAVGMAYAYGVPMEEIRTVLRRFTAVEHRIEYVAEKGGVVYYNDSKGTNPDAAIKAVEAMDRPTVLIGGGYDKNSDYEEWIQTFPGRVKCLVLVGQTKEKIADACERCGFTDYVLTDTFEEAFAVCTQKAVQGDAVLLSPACASWGMFPNYEVRGKVFKELVNSLPDD